MYRNYNHIIKICNFAEIFKIMVSKIYVEPKIEKTKIWKHNY